MISFESYCERRQKEALAATMSGFSTVEDRTDEAAFVAIGNDWTRGLFDGDFYRLPAGRASSPLVSLVFVQSRDGNTVADNPSTLGGGETDKHLIYEGLSRVDADAVMAGAATARSERLVFSVWHPELVRLRLSRGRPRHPAQVIVTATGDLAVERALLFNEPSLPVFVITRSPAAAPLRARVGGRGWVDVIDAGDPLSLTRALAALHERGVRVISAVGGRRTATALLQEGLVSELYLTTSSFDAGEPHTPFYEGPPLPWSRIVLKTGRGAEAGVRFEHCVLR